jgi:hypothetical protein
MSDREKKLVFLFGFAAFVLLNVFGIKWFMDKKAALSADLAIAEEKVLLSETFSGKYDTVLSEMEWIGAKAPEPRSVQIVNAELQQYVENQAKTHQLEIKRQGIKTGEQTGQHFHRSKVEFNVTGKEDSLYRWLDRLQMPDQFRAITFLRLSPDAKDDTLIDATVEAEQWFVPQTNDDSEGSAEGPEATPAPTPAPVPDTAKPPGTP